MVAKFQISHHDILEQNMIPYKFVHYTLQMNNLWLESADIS